MLTRRFGKTDLQLSALGMGCWAIGGVWTWRQPGELPYPAGWGKVDDQESVRAIHAALDAGVTLFDTAANYGAGHSERVLGQALKGRRNQVVIATKFGHIVNEAEKVVYGDDTQILANLRGDVENSLRRLQTDWIDVYQLHQGSFDALLAAELRGMLGSLVQQGKIRWYGWSTDLVDRAEVFATGEHCSSIQFQLNALVDNPEMRDLCAAHDLAGLNKDPLHRGVLTGKFTPETTFPDDDIRSQVSFKGQRMRQRLEAAEALRELLTSGGRTMAQGALAYIWALDPRMFPIPGFKSVQQVQENAGAMNLGPLEADTMRQIQELVAGYQLEFG